MRNIVVIVGALVGVAGCGGSQPTPEAPATTGGASESPAPSAAETPPPGSDAAPARPKLTAEQCEASGGTVVGDIGDGAVHRPDYRCESGAAPTGSITAPEGGPIAVEGSVCCPK